MFKCILILVIICIIFLFIFSKKKNEVPKCENGYCLIRGKCKFYSFSVIYRSNLINEKIELINEKYLSTINIIYFNNQSISLKSNFNFPSPGNHLIYVYMDISSANSISKMFKDINNIISISFTNEFIYRAYRIF